MDELLYQMIFKRKSFHIMKSDLLITNDEINEIYQIYEELIPLYDDIRTRIKIVEIEKTNCPRGQYCILFYSEVKEGYECGMSFENYNDIQVNDSIECYEVEEIAKTL